jgi:hypothetical protein
MKRKAKIENLVETIRECVASGRYLDTYHSHTRQSERKITRPEIIFVLKNGYHERMKDSFDEQHKEWNYAIRGKTIDKKILRIIVSFDSRGLLIITAIELDS